MHCPSSEPVAQVQNFEEESTYESDVTSSSTNTASEPMCWNPSIPPFLPHCSATLSRAQQVPRCFTEARATNENVVMPVAGEHKMSTEYQYRRRRARDDWYTTRGTWEPILDSIQTSKCSLYHPPSAVKFRTYIALVGEEDPSSATSGSYA